MTEEDLGKFAMMIQNMGSLFCRRIGPDEVEAYFDFLKEYSLRTIHRALEKAANDRDPSDIYLRTCPLTALEIKAAAVEVLVEDSRNEKFKIGCDKCAGTGFILDSAKNIAKRCECWLEAMKARKIEEARK